ncbi:nucleotide-binding alpha-beta plait domain-containing protein [Tanacetum coccineum]
MMSKMVFMGADGKPFMVRRKVSIAPVGTDHIMGYVQTKLLQQVEDNVMPNIGVKDYAKSKVSDRIKEAPAVSNAHGSPSNGDTKSDVNKTKPTSFANILNAHCSHKNVNFRSFVNEEQVENFDTVLPRYAIDKVNKYANSLVGYFIGKRLAFLIVQNYVNNTWGKFRIQKLMRNDDGVFLFKFAAKKGMEQVLERGPWMIQNTSLIINKWNPSLPLKKNEVIEVPVWVKLHKVPLVAYSKDGLSLIATQIGKPLMLDAFTSSMCVESWGHISFARVLVKISSDTNLKKEVTMTVPNEDELGYTREVISVEYEWQPPRCDYCQIFGHSYDKCPKIVREPITFATTMEKQSDRFTEVKSKKNKGKKAENQQPNSRHIGGIQLSKHKPSFYRPKPVTKSTHGNAASLKPTEYGDASTSHAKHGEHSSPMSNYFDVLNTLAEEEEGGFPKPACTQETSKANKPSSSMVDQREEFEENEVMLHGDEISNYISSTGGGKYLEDDDMSFYDGYYNTPFLTYSSGS